MRTKACKSDDKRQERGFSFADTKNVGRRVAHVEKTKKLMVWCGVVVVVVVVISELSGVGNGNYGMLRNQWEKNNAKKAL